MYLSVFISETQTDAQSPARPAPKVLGAGQGLDGRWRLCIKINILYKID
jgi:hypothetical protein